MTMRTLGGILLAIVPAIGIASALERNPGRPFATAVATGDHRESLPTDSSRRVAAPSENRSDARSDTHMRRDIETDSRRSFLIGYGVDPDRGSWLPVAGAANAWRRIDASPSTGQSTSGEDCPPFVFRNGFDAGRLSQDGGIGSQIMYVSSGGYVILVDRHQLIIRDPHNRNRVEHWGDPHENLNGKHIKDWGGEPGWDGFRRTIILGDGTKLTMSASGAQGIVTDTSIYDDFQNVQITNTANTIIHHGTDPADTRDRDDAQHDGETALFQTDSLTGVGDYTNIYNENPDFEKVPFNQPLGRSGGCANPNQVNDYYDDPRLGHT